jgi:hypothetical protein
VSQAVLPHAPAVDAPALVRSHALVSSGVRALLLILFAKALVIGCVWLGYNALDLSGVYAQNDHYHQPSEYGPLTRFTTWDSSYYLLLARDGYPDGAHQSNAFAPLLPLSIRAVGQLTGDLVIAGLLVSNAASAAALWLLWSLVRRRWGESTAWRTLVLLLAFPTAFFLSLVYSESLFLLLAVLTFWGLDRASSETATPRGWGLAIAAAAAFLLPLTRAIGAVIVLPLLIWVAVTYWQQAYRCQSPSRAWWLAACGLLLAPLAGVLADAAYMQLAAGDWLAHVHSEALFPAHWQLSNAFKPWVFATELAGRGLSFHGYLNSAVDRLFFVAFLASVPLVYRRVDKPLFVFYLLLGLLPPLMGSFMAYTRLLLPAFPLFIAWASSLETRPRLLTALVTSMVLIQALALLAHTSSRWVA